MASPDAYLFEVEPGQMSSLVCWRLSRNGGKPHHHTKSAEMFYVLDGRVELLSGKEIVKAEPGDVIVVPPLMPHAFAAEKGSSADILIIIAPGVERFEYFRQLTRIAREEENRRV
jgi:mannose-6-phosphate isomerase-like protein (cupin superfamily)